MAVPVRLEGAEDPLRIGQEGLELGDGKVHAALEGPGQVHMDLVPPHTECAPEAHGRHDGFELGPYGNRQDLLRLHLHRQPVQELLDPRLQLGELRVDPEDRLGQFLRRADRLHREPATVPVDLDGPLGGLDPIEIVGRVRERDGQVREAERHAALRDPVPDQLRDRLLGRPRHPVPLLKVEMLADEVREHLLGHLLRRQRREISPLGPARFDNGFIEFDFHIRKRFCVRAHIYTSAPLQSFNLR